MRGITRLFAGVAGAAVFYLFTQSATVTKADLQDIVEANAFDAPAFAADVGVAAPAFQVVDKLADVPVGGVPCGFFDGLDEPGALAYHTTVAGRPSISVDASGSLSETQKGFSHEWKELLGDALATSQVATVDARGKVVGIALEFCDPVQNVPRSVTIRSGAVVVVSAHVTAWWFCPVPPPGVALDSEGTIASPLTCGDGYVSQVNYTDGTAETINGAGAPPVAAALDKHPATRGGKRQAAMAAVVDALRRAA